MYKISFTATNEFDDNDEHYASFSMTFPEQPSWHRLAETFKQFLQGQGYVFDLNDRLDIVNDDPVDDSDDEPDIIQFDEPEKKASRGKAKKK